jgi:hypothetical protein
VPEVTAEETAYQGKTIWSRGDHANGEEAAESRSEEPEEKTTMPD